MSVPNQIINLVFFAASVLAFAYMFLGLWAYRDCLETTANKNAFTVSPLWAFYAEAYGEQGQRVCETGKKVFWVETALMVVWLMLE